ncbi:hypothetical protein BCR34DRAFT_574566 [Clohesyomyces aquaticus]|uniref:Uncharacterized protein n=1 Tax=Clohesyomyces aquaticus TaxID=1231657 RepID=A0A1Y1YV47_9PLEO|nr:hypothetical protein BCR34DRAFT_574566 [Clohesyomyces aquaticus]
MYSAPLLQQNRSNFNNSVNMPARVKREVTIPSIHLLLRDEDLDQDLSSSLLSKTATNSSVAFRGVSPKSAYSVSPTPQSLNVTLQQLASPRAERTRIQRRVKNERKSDILKEKSKRKQKAKKEQLQRTTLTTAIAQNEKSVVDLMPHGRLPKAFEGQCLTDNNAEQGLDYNKITVLKFSASMHRISRPLFQYLRENYMHDPEICRCLTMVSNLEHPILMPRWTDPTPRKPLTKKLSKKGFEAVEFMSGGNPVSAALEQ